MLCRSCTLREFLISILLSYTLSLLKVPPPYFPTYFWVIFLNIFFSSVSLLLWHFQSYEYVLCAEVGSILRQCSASQSTCLLYQEQWKDVWCTIENIYQTVVHCGDLWKDTNKSLGKRRAFSGLLKQLESSGMSRHKSIYMEVIKIGCWDISCCNLLLRLFVRYYKG